MTRHNHLSPTKHSRATTLYHDIKLCTLEVVCGVDMGASVHPLSEFTVVGRKPSCDLILSDTKASGMRCALRTTEDRVTLKDLGRTNGTSCQGVRIVEAFLEPDSVFQVGDTLIKLKVHDGSQPVARMPCDPTGRLIGSAPAMQEIFAYKQETVDSQGRVQGRFLTTGIRPRCMDRLEAAGIHLPADLFDPTPRRMGGKS